MVNRLLSIIYILMNKGTVTAAQLADRFEVSLRTIYRDIDALSMAGIPVYTTKGRNGGIHLMEQFVLDKMLVSKKEQQQILAALASLKETGSQDEEAILGKLGDFFKEKSENWVSIDFSDWSGRRKELFNRIRDAILNRQVMQFDYYGQYGDMSSRCVEPIQLLFKEYTWYVRAFCRTRQAMRLFKVLRMKRVVVLEETFTSREKLLLIPEDEQFMENTRSIEVAEAGNAAVCGKLPGTEESGKLPAIILWINRKEAYRVYDRFEEDEITVLPDGHFRIQLERCFPDDWIYGMILSFGSSAQVLEPEWVRREIHRRIKEMKKLYDQD